MNRATREDLQQYRTLRGRVTAWQTALARLQRETAQMRRDGETMDGDGGRQMESLAAQMNDLVRMRAQALVEAESALARVEGFLASLPPGQADVIRLRYVEGARFCGWQKTARLAGYSVDGAYNAHRLALKKLGQTQK